jgi:tellurium resistance protein TerD
MMSTTVNLTKGQRVELTKGTNIKNIIVGLGWSTRKYSGGHEFDLDASAFLLGTNGKCTSTTDMIFYNNTKDINGSIIYGGDNLTGSTGDNDDESLTIHLDKVAGSVDKIAFTVTIYDHEARKQNFGQVDKAYIRVVDADTNKEVIRYNLVEDFSSETALVVGELYRNGADWKFNAVGSGYSGGLKALVSSYGLQA